MTATTDHANELMIRAEALLDDALNLQLGLSEDDSIYTVSYIQEKVTRVSVYQERLSDIQTKLSKMHLEILRVGGQLRSLKNTKERRLKGSDEYADQDRSVKTLWLVNQLEHETEQAEAWEFARKVVSEVREAVAERLSTMKRLDSSIRLQSRILETKHTMGLGASSPSSYTGNRTDEMDID